MEKQQSSGRNIGVALSGGGKRAAFYSVGVLTAMVDCGLSSDVTLLSSVSGSSFVNAALAYGRDYSAISEEEMRLFAGKLIRELSGHRHMFRGFFIVVTASILYSLSNLGLGGQIGDRLTRGIGLGAVLDDPYAALILRVFLVALCVVLAFATRTLAQEVIIDRFVQRAILGRPLRKIESLTMGALPSSRVKHVFCLTDLELGVPIYLYGSIVLTGDSLHQTDGSLSVTDAIVGSAAFPGAFLPTKIELKDLNGKTLRRLIATDGGVWNNLGSDPVIGDFFLVPALPSISSETLGKFQISAHVGRALRTDEIDLGIIVDGSAAVPSTRLDPSSTWHVYTVFGTLWAEIRSLARISKILYLSGLSTRQSNIVQLEQLYLENDFDRSIAYLNISLSASELAQSYIDYEDEEVSNRGVIARDWLFSMRNGDYWDGIRDTSAQMPTHLRKEKRKVSFDTARHGYFCAIVKLYCLGAIDLPPTS